MGRVRAQVAVVGQAVFVQDRLPEGRGDLVACLTCVRAPSDGQLVGRGERAEMGSDSRAGRRAIRGPVASGVGRTDLEGDEFAHGGDCTRALAKRGGRGRGATGLFRTNPSLDFVPLARALLQDG